MNLKDYPTLNLDIYIKVKAQRFYCCSAFHNHSSVFNKEHKSYYKTSIKQHLTCSLAVQTLFKFTITRIFLSFIIKEKKRI